MRQYLLCGATGVIGSALLKRLLKSNEQVVILIRAESDNHLKNRLADLFCYLEITEAARSLILPLRADLYTPGLGLSAENYQDLLGRVTHILHCAGDVTMNLPAAVAEQKTLAMTHHLVGLMEESCCVRKMEYVSTIGVAGNTPGGIAEEWLLHDRTFRNSYEAAKSKAEIFIQKKIEQGLNITVHRPSMVVGDSRTGKNIRFQVFYHLCEFLSGVRTLGVIPDLNGMFLDVISSDYMAKMIYWASLQDRDLPRVLHACSGQDGSIGLNDLSDRVYSIFQENGRSLPGIKRVPLFLFQSLAATARPFVSKKTRRSLDTLPLFFAYLGMPQYFINTKTRNLAQAAGINLPRIEDYLEPVLRYYLEKKQDIIR